MLTSHEKSTLLIPYQYQETAKEFFSTHGANFTWSLRHLSSDQGDRAQLEFLLHPLLSISAVAVFSPLLILVDQAVVEEELLNFHPTIIPDSHEFIISNIQEVVRLRGAVSAISLVGLLWSSTSVFSIIIRNINAAWPSAAPHSFIRMRLWSLAIIAAMAFVLSLSSCSITFKQLLARLEWIYSSQSLAILSSYFYTTDLPFCTGFRLFRPYYWFHKFKVNKMGALTALGLTFMAGDYDCF